MSIPFNQTPQGGTVPTIYAPGQVPTDPAGYGIFLKTELDKIARCLRSLSLLTPQAATLAPAHPVENMIRFAKSPWRPVSGQTTDRWVTYAGGQWVYLSST